MSQFSSLREVTSYLELNKCTFSIVYRFLCLQVQYPSWHPPTKGTSHPKESFLLLQNMSQEYLVSGCLVYIMLLTEYMNILSQNVLSTVFASEGQT